MALADYRLCDICERKVFYDSNLNYEFGKTSWYGGEINESNSIKYCGELALGTKLERLGDWAVICDDCAKEYECKVVKKGEE